MSLAIATTKPKIPTYRGGKVNWDVLVREYARAHDMTYAECMRWLSSRTSLQVGVEVMGIVLTSHLTNNRPTAGDLDMLNQLGAYLDNHGYKVPRLTEMKPDAYVPSEKVYNACEDIDPLWRQRDVDDVIKAWSQGLSVEHIAEAMERSYGDVLVLIVSLSALERIKPRKNGIMGNRRPEVAE